MLLTAALLMPENLANQARHGLMLQFVTYNGFGNNLYIDNVITGNRSNFDLAITAFNNIPSDTAFLAGTQEFYEFPQITVTNIGLTNSTDSTSIFLDIPEIGYADSAKVGPLASGQVNYGMFSGVTIPVNQRVTLIAFLRSTADSTETNDTIRQTTVFLTGATKRMLLEEFTSSTSPACGSNNLFLDTFINNNFGKISSIKYHVGFPPPGIDSMYLFDTTMIEERRGYYFANTVPLSIIDGRQRLLLPYYVDSNLYIPYEQSISAGSPVELTVTSTQVAYDTMETVVNVNFLHAVPNRELKLRVAAVERDVIYQNAIGASGESVFYDVCRKMLPDAEGTALSGDPGSQQFTFRYYIDTLWNDSALYTVAFVQSDIDRSVINSGKSDTVVFRRHATPYAKSTGIIKPDYDIRYRVPKSNPLKYFAAFSQDTVSYFNYENFEGPFLPKGWHLNNIDGFLTYEKINAINGSTLGGYSCVKMPFYDYSNIGQKDTLYSVIFDSVSAYDTLSFDWAYAVYLSTFTDSLEVSISIDGGTTFTSIFDEGGYNLATAVSTTLPFAPSGASQWRTFKYALSGVIPVNPQNIVPLNFELEQNYPNPFNPSTTIRYKLPMNSFVSIKIFDITGKLIRTLINENRHAGNYEAVFNAAGLPSGIYFCMMNAGDFSQTRKLVLIK